MAQWVVPGDYQPLQQQQPVQGVYNSTIPSRSPYEITYDYPASSSMSPQHLQNPYALSDQYAPSAPPPASFSDQPVPISVPPPPTYNSLPPVPVTALSPIRTSNESNPHHQPQQQYQPAQQPYQQQEGVGGVGYTPPRNPNDPSSQQLQSSFLTPQQLQEQQRTIEAQIQQLQQQIQQATPQSTLSSASRQQPPQQQQLQPYANANTNVDPSSPSLLSPPNPLAQQYPPQPLPPLPQPPRPLFRLPASVGNSVVSLSPGIPCADCGFGKWQSGVPCPRCRTTSMVAVAHCKYCATKNSFPSHALLFTCYICHMTSDLSADRIDEEALESLVTFGGFSRLEVAEHLFDLQIQYASSNLQKDPSSNQPHPPPPPTSTYEEIAQKLSNPSASIATSTTLYPTPGAPSSSSASPIEIFTVARVAQLRELAREPSNLNMVESEIFRIFSSAKSLARSFLREGAPAVPTTVDSGLDFTAIRSFYSMVLSLPSRSRVTLFTALGDLLGKPLLFHEPEQIRILLIVLENPLFMRLSESRDNVARLCSRMASLAAWQAQFLIHWLSGYSSAPHVFWAFVNLINSFLALRIDNGVSHRGPIHNDWTVVSATKSIGLLNSANEIGHIIKYVEFRNRKVNEVIDVEAEFRNWPNQAVFSFCSYPYLLNLATKNSVMKLENQEVQTAMFAESVRDITTGRGVTIPFLALRVRREHLIFDTLAQLSGKTRELKKQLKVQFAAEEGVDAGGVQKEFFQLIVRQLFDPAYGMFTYSEDSRQFWFNFNSLESESEFELIGTIIGLAIYNSVILDLRFPSVVYKKLLNQKPTLVDLEDMNADLARGLRQLLDYQEPDVEDVFCLNFTISEEVFGVVNIKPLKENGDNIPVTNANRQEYVDLYVNYVMEDSIKKQFTAFQRGFYRVCAGSALKLIRPEELELLVCGDSNEIDIDDLEHATAYQHYTKESPSIKNLWSVVREMTPENKKKFLTFATGSDRVPCKGVSHLALVITRDGPDSNRLPTAHTCFNQVLLPDYSTKRKLSEKLTLAINNCEGFGLK